MRGASPSSTDRDDADVSARSLLAEPELLAVLFLALVGITGVQAVPPALPFVSTALGVGDATVGLVMTAFFATAAVALPLLGPIADVYGRKRFALTSLAVFGVTGLAVPFVDSFRVLLALRALQGLAFPGIVPLSITLVGDLYDGTTGSTAHGLRVSVTGLVSTTVPVLAGAIAAVAWFSPFVLYALAFPAFVVVARYLPETSMRTDESASASIAAARTYVRGLAAELRDAELAVFVGGAFVVFLARFGVVTFLPVYAVRELGTSGVVAGLLLSAMGASRTAVASFAGTFVSRVTRRRAVPLALAGAGASTAVLAASQAVWVLGVASTGYGASTALFTPVLNDSVTSMASDERRASVVNAMELSKTVAIAAAPTVFGVILAVAGFQVVFAVAAVMTVGYAGVFAATL
jgi:MFS family permease